MFAVVSEAGPQEITAGNNENRRHHGIAGHAERPRRIGFFGAQHEQCDADQHEKSPEHRQRILDQAFEARIVDGAESDQRECNHALHHDGITWRTALLIPFAEESEQRPVTAQRVVGARADDDGAVDGSKGSHGDHERNEFLAGRSQHVFQQVRRHGIGARHCAVPQALQVGKIDQNVKQGDDADRAQQGARHVLLAVLHFCRNISRVVPAAVGEQHEHHGRADAGPHVPRAAAGRSGRRRRRFAGENKTGDDDQHQAPDFQHSKEILRDLGLAYAGVVHNGETADHQRGPDGR